MNTALVTVLTLVGSGMVSLLIAILTGKLVPSSRVDDAEEKAEKQITAAEAKADKFQLAYETQKHANDLLEETVKRQHMVTDTANMLIGMMQTATQKTPPSPSSQAGGPL